MPEDKPGLIEKIHAALGLKASPEQQAETDRIKREGAAANAELKEVFDASAERIRRGLEANAAASHQAAQAALDRSSEQLAHQPKQLDSVNDMKALLAAAGNRESIVDVRNRTTIHKWDDGYGKVIYLRPSVRIDQVQAVSARITEQRGAFDALGVDEQTSIRTDFESSKGIAESTQPYKDHLQSEALGKRFQELKQSPPAPK